MLLPNQPESIRDQAYPSIPLHDQELIRAQVRAEVWEDAARELIIQLSALKRENAMLRDTLAGRPDVTTVGQRMRGEFVYRPDQRGYRR